LADAAAASSIVSTFSPGGSVDGFWARAEEEASNETVTRKAILSRTAGRRLKATLFDRCLHEWGAITSDAASIFKVIDHTTPGDHPFTFRFDSFY
jgi:hypothetical protein